MVAERVELAESLWSRFWGLMGRKKLAPGHALYLRSASSVHTAFMRFPIDIIFLEKDGRVRKVVPALEPFRVALDFGSSGVLELIADTAAQAQVTAGDKLTFSEGD